MRAEKAALIKAEAEAAKREEEMLWWLREEERREEEEDEGMDILQEFYP